VVNTPYTRWTSDDLHGRTKIITPVWVRLDLLCVRAEDAPLRVVPDGLDMTGTVPGQLSGWFRTVKGDWLGIVDYAVPYADGRARREEFKDQLVPHYALAKRDVPGYRKPDS
jgi:hypothetical protein